MITLLLGALGAGKTANAVRIMKTELKDLKTYTNIITKGIPNAIYTPDSKILEEYKHERTGKMRVRFNKDFWLALPKPMNVVLDEVHLFADSRKSQSNAAVTEFIAMGRRIVGFDKRGYGRFIFIAQTLGSVELRIRQQTNQIIYHKLLWIYTCVNCGARFTHDNEKGDLDFCPYCGEARVLEKSDWTSERFEFRGANVIRDYEEWILTEGRSRKYKRRRRLPYMEQYFKNYDTLQYIKTDQENNEINPKTNPAIASKKRPNKK